MNLRQLQVFTGPSIHARHPVVRVSFEEGDTGVLSTAEAQTRLEKLLSPFDRLSRPLATAKEMIAAQDSVDWAHIYGALAVAFQEDRFTEPLAFRVETGAGDHERVVLVEFNEPGLAELSAQFAVQWLPLIYNENWEQNHEDPQGWLGKGIQSFLRSRIAIRLNENTRVLIEAAQVRDVPVMRLAPDSETQVLGQGCRRQRLSQCMGDSTSAVAIRVIARNKSITSQLLRDAAVPVPKQFVVRTKTQLADAVQQIGFPLVVKGATVDHGASVTTGINSNEELQVAIKKVQQFQTEILVEQQIEGDDHRLTVINGRLVAAARRTPPQITGDGERTIRQLMEGENKRRRNLGRYAHWLVPLMLDEDTVATLSRQGHSPDSVPQAGEIIVFRSVANLSQGGLSEDVTELVHPDVVYVAERAARLVGLDMAGVDILTTDISRPLSETGGGILEVNNWPGLRPHYVTETPRDVAGAVIDYLFPDETRGRIPTVAVTGTNGKTTTCRMLRRIFEIDGRVVGMSTSTDVTIDGETILRGDSSGGAYANMILKDPIVEAGIFELARGALIRHGTRLDGYTVGVVTNVSNDHLELDGIATIEEMARVKRLVAEMARQGAVLNADDAQCVAMVPQIPAPIWWFTLDPDNLVVQKHLAENGNAVVVAEREGREVLLHCGANGEEEVVSITDIPATWDGRLRVNVENAAAAAASALAAGVAASTIGDALRSFTTSVDDSPGRFNIYETNGITVILDFAHNIVGLEKMIELMDQLPQQGRRLCFFSLTNSRDQHHYGLVTKVLAHHFDHYVVSDQTPLSKRRSETEIMNWLKDGLIAAGVDTQSVEGTTDVWDGISKTLAMARAGDVVFVKTGADPYQYWEQIKSFVPS